VHFNPKLYGFDLHDVLESKNGGLIVRPERHSRVTGGAQFFDKNGLRPRVLDSFAW